MTNTLRRIKQFIDYKGLSVKRFEEYVGMSNGSFASQLKNNKTIGVDKLEKILFIYPEINLDWLLTGDGEMLKPPGLMNEAESRRQEKDVAEGKIHTSPAVPQFIADSEAYQDIYNKYIVAIQELESKKQLPSQENSYLIDKFFHQLEEKNKEIKELSREIGRVETENCRLQYENEQLKNRKASSVDYAFNDPPVLMAAEPVML
jgi:transcriptional regulator with XRE-family HTH domain